MAYIVHKDQSDTVERLPHITETSIWADYDCPAPSKSAARAVMLYMAVADRENYFQDHTPTPFGNPTHERYCGIVDGIKMAAGIVEEDTGDRLIFRKGKRNVLVVDKVSRPESYHADLKENAELLRAFGL